MASVIILSLGEGRHLVCKPTDYATLIDVARTKFPELDGVDNDNIAFHFTPEWFDNEVKLDGDAFGEVHNRAVLRITTTASALPPCPANGGSIEGDVDGMITFRVIHVPTERSVWYKLAPRKRVYKLMVRAAAFFEVNLDNYDFTYRGRILYDGDTLQSIGMEDRGSIEMKFLE